MEDFFAFLFENQVYECEGENLVTSSKNSKSQIG